MEKGPRPDGLTNRQRAKREVEAQKNKAAKLKKRVGVAVGTTLASLAVIGGAYVAQRGGDSEQQPSYTNSTEDYSQNMPLRELTSAHVDDLAFQVSNDYERLTGVEIDENKVVNVLKLAPNYSKMTPAEKIEFCGTPEIPLRCQEVAGVKTRDERIIIYKDGIDRRLTTASDAENNRILRDDVLYHTIAHEITHWIAPAFPLSDELGNLLKKHYGDQFPEIRNPLLYENDVVRGSGMGMRRTNDSVAATIFSSAEEAESDIIAKYILVNSGRIVIYDVNEKKDFYEVESNLMDDMLHKLSPTYSESIKLLAKSRVVQGGREELLKTIGKRFGASDEEALEHGFKIYMAIESLDTEAYKQLTE